MKTLPILLIAILSLTNGFGQSNTTKSLQKFTELKVYDRIKITLIKGVENKLVLSGNDKDEVNFSENNGLLKIKMSDFLSGNTVNAYLYYTEVLTLVDANENAKIQSNEVLKGTKIEVKAQESSIISLILDMEYVTVKSSTGSEITLSGSTRNQNINVNTGGKVYNKELFSKESMVTVLAGGHAEVHGTDKVVARVKAGGSISVHGNPKILEKDNTFGGKITVIE